jgi:hypothetical protein
MLKNQMQPNHKHGAARTLFIAAFIAGLFASPGRAQSVPTVSNIIVDPLSADATSFRLFFDTSASYVNFRVRFGTAGCAGGSGGSVQLYGTALSTVVRYAMTADLSGLTAGATYHICPEVTADGTHWSSGAELVYTMPAGLPSGEPVPPAEPALVSTVFPAQTGQTVAVAADCHDFQADINAAHYGDTILIPAGAVCTQGVVLPNAPEARTFQPSAVNTTAATITLTAHGFANGQKVHLSTAAPNGGCLPGQEFYSYGSNCDKAGGIRKGRDYYIKLVDANHFQLSETPGGPTAPFGFIKATANASAGTVTTTGDWAAPQGYTIFSNVPMQFTTTGTLPGGISANTDYYALTACLNGASQSCTFRISLTQGGAPVAITSGGAGALSIATHGTGAQYIMAWPPANKWIVVRTATPDSQFTPPGVRTSKAWQPRMATIKQTAPSPAGAMINAGILTHNWRFIGLELTTATNNDIAMTVDPRPYGNLVVTDPDNGYIIFDRVYMHGWGFPNRFGKTAVNMDGYAVGFINSEMSQMDFFHSWYSGFAPAIVSPNVATLTPGSSFMGQLTPTTTGTTTIRILGGESSGNGVMYFDMTGVLQVVLPVGLQAACTTTGVTCNVTTANGPQVPISPAGGNAGEAIAGLTFLNGAITSFNLLDGFSGIYDTEGCQCFLMGNGPGPFIFDNNYISGSGIPLHFDDSGGPYLIRGDYYIHRNSFNVPLTEMAGGPISNGLRYGHRQPLEWKGGLRIKVDGNKFNGNFQEDTPTTPFIAIIPRSGGWMSDIQVTNNTFQHGPSGLYTCGAIDSFVPVSRPCQRQVYRNNLFSDINGFTHSIVNGPFGIGPGKLLDGGYANSDLVFDHNTVASVQLGTQPEFIHNVLSQASNYRITNNILWIANGVLELVGNENIFLCPGGGTIAFVNCAFPFSRWAGNLVIPSYLDTSVPAGAVDPGTLCTAFGGVWNGSACSGGLIPDLVTGPDVPTRIANVKFRADGGLQFNSPYTSKAADGRDPGVNMDTLNQAQGWIGVGDASNITPSSVTFRVVVPDPGASCMIAYGLTSDPTLWTRTAPNTSQSTTRTFTLTGLQSTKMYLGEVWCAGAPPRPLFFSTL